MWHLIIALFMTSSLSFYSTSKADKPVEILMVEGGNGSKGGDKGDVRPPIPDVLPLKDKA